MQKSKNKICCALLKYLEVAASLILLAQTLIGNIKVHLFDAHHNGLVPASWIGVLQPCSWQSTLCYLASTRNKIVKAMSLSIKVQYSFANSAKLFCFLYLIPSLSLINKFKNSTHNLKPRL